MSRLSKPEYREHIYAIGRITLAMSFADYQIEDLVELYLGEDAGRIVIEELGRNRDKSNLLRKLVEATEKDAGLAAALIGCIDAYAVHRENRNKLAHAFSIALEEEAVRLERASGKAAIPIAATKITPNDLNAMIDQLDKLNGELSFGTLYKAQELGYQVFKGSIRIGPPSSPPLPSKFPDVDHQVLAASLTKLEKRVQNDPQSNQSG